jgi:predicted neutral ceramidase superfamily lipid hydrolase
MSTYTHQDFMSGVIFITGTLVLACHTDVILGDKITMSVTIAIWINILAMWAVFMMLSLVETNELGFKGSHLFLESLDGLIEFIVEVMVL